jgi:hypothetical protein
MPNPVALWATEGLQEVASEAPRFLACIRVKKEKRRRRHPALYFKAPERLVSGTVI